MSLLESLLKEVERDKQKQENFGPEATRQRYRAARTTRVRLAGKTVRKVYEKSWLKGAKCIETPKSKVAEEDDENDSLNCEEKSYVGESSIKGKTLSISKRNVVQSKVELEMRRNRIRHLKFKERKAESSARKESMKKLKMEKARLRHEERLKQKKKNKEEIDRKDGERKKSIFRAKQKSQLRSLEAREKVLQLKQRNRDLIQLEKQRAADLALAKRRKELEDLRIRSAEVREQQKIALQSRRNGKSTKRARQRQQWLERIEREEQRLSEAKDRINTLRAVEFELIEELKAAQENHQKVLIEFEKEILSSVD
eukprot:g1223.t1